MSVSLIIFYIVFPISLLLGIKGYRGGRTVLLSKSESDFLKGMASLMVVFAHYCLRLEEDGQMLTLIFPFRFLGPLGVAFFFFLSGYGLYISNGITKLKVNFIKKRLVSVYFPYIFIRICSLFFREILLADLAEPKDIFLYILGITINSFWFIVVIMFMYIIYYVISFLQVTDVYKICILFIVIAGYSMILFSLKGYDASYWYGNNMIFPLGVLCAYYQTQLTNLIKKYKQLFLCISSLLFMLMVGLYFVFDGVLLITIKMLTGIFLITIFLIIFHYVKLGNPLMQFLGRYSLYIYLTHTFIYRILYQYMDMSSQTSVLLYFIFVILIPVMCKALFNVIVCFFKKIRVYHPF